MTMQHQDSGNLPANPEDFAGTGLEDFGVTDAVIPRLQIVHKEGVFKDNLSGQTFPELRLVVLGLVKQRILWHHEQEDDAVPMCKSPEFATGYPNLELSGKKEFPWREAGFDPSNFPTKGDQKPLPCASCQLKEWGTHPKLDSPYCAEQWTLPVYYDASQDASGQWVPAILTLQKSSLKPIRSYLTSFARTQKPAFTAVCKVTLQVRTRGSVDYSVPSFSYIEDSDRSRWMEFSQNYAEMKSYLTSPPRSEDDGESNSSDNTNTAPVQQQAPPQQQPPAQQPPPQQQAPAQQAPPQQQAPAQQAPPQQQPPAQQAPPQQQPPAQQAPPPAGDDDLPF